MKFLQEELRKRIVAAVGNDYPLQIDDIQFSVPAERTFGDLATPLAFTLAKRMKDNPRAIGNALRAKIKIGLESIADITLAGGGFINFHFNRQGFWEHLLKNRERQQDKKNEKVIVEHTSINPNKSAHIGHLRNSSLGDMLARSMAFLGYEVEVQNYIDDTGIQIADVVWGLLVHQKKSFAEIRRIPSMAAYLWDLYSEVNRCFEKDQSLVQQRNEVHKKMETKVNPEYEVSQYISHQVLKDHIALMESLNIRFDLLVRESDIIELEFFSRAAELLKQKKVMTLSQDPEKKGCWVIFYDKEQIEKIIVRSNQTVTYVGKDLAYNLWKFGLLDKEFYYQEFHSYPDSQKISVTTPHKKKKKRYSFGRADQVYNVIDVRQSYLQNLIAQVLQQLGHSKQARHYTHFAYERVALTPACIKELGFELSPEDKKKTQVDVSGRKGIAVKADDLIAKMVEKSRHEVEQHHPGIDRQEARSIALDIAVGALRYYLIKFSLNSVIAFDFKDALNFEGDTGPYLQYTLVRINSILKKMGWPENAWPSGPFRIDGLAPEEKEDFWGIILLLSQLEIQVEFAIASSEPALIASFAFQLCQKFNQYYHLYPIIAEKNEMVRNLRLALILLFKEKAKKIFDIMGIPIPEKM